MVLYVIIRRPSVTAFPCALKFVVDHFPTMTATSLLATMISLIRGLSEVEMSPSQLTCETLSRVFGVSIACVY